MRQRSVGWGAFSNAAIRFLTQIVAQHPVLQQPVFLLWHSMLFPAEGLHGNRIRPKNRSPHLAVLPVLQCLDKCQASRLRLPRDLAHKLALAAFAASIPISLAIFRSL